MTARERAKVPLSLEVERKYNHLIMTGDNGVGESPPVYVLNGVHVILVERVGQTVTELQLGNEFEEGQIEGAPQAHF